MTTDEVRAGARSERDRETAILERVDKIDNLLSSVLADFRVHLDLLRAEVIIKERAGNERA